MDRQGHDYSENSAMVYAQQQRPNMQQQQQQFGFPPQHQQFPSPLHNPPFLPGHLPQFPFRHPMQQQPPQLPPHAHLLHQQPPAFPPHMAPPPLIPSHFVGPYDSAPPPAAPPHDPELHKRIDKLVEYIAKNGPQFEAMIREKQQDNPEYSFLMGGDGHAYYQYRLRASTRPSGAHFPPFTQIMHPPPNPLINPSLPLNTPRASSGSMLGLPQIHQPPFSSFYDPLAHQSFSRPEYDQPTKSFKGLSGPLPSDVAAELSNVLNNLTGTKDSIKGAKIWFMQRSPFAPALAEALRERVFSLDDSDRQLHIIFVANDILFESLQRRANVSELDNEALAFKPVLGSMLARIYHNPQNREENQSRLKKILQFWASKEVYDQETISALENEMVSGVSSNAFHGFSKELSAATTDASGVSQQATNPKISYWQQHDRQGSAPGLTDKGPDHAVSFPGITPPLSTPQFLPNAVIPGPPFTASVPIPASAQPANQTPILPPNLGEKLPPYPMFPPGLIPGMVRKMQIGSGVPYSPLSPLDIPNTIPPSNVPQSEILERVSKFFREIGEVNPSEGPMSSSGTRDDDEDDEYEYEREPVPRKGGACIPPPPNLRVDPEIGSHADGSVEGKGSGSGRLGLGATANPNEVSQYDDVYTSYRKQRSTSYHSSMSARAATR